MKEMTRTAERGLGRPSVPTCPECGSRFRRELVSFRVEGQLLGSFPADVCGNRHEYFTEASGTAIQAAAKARGLWGKGMAATVGGAVSGDARGERRRTARS